jgi:hypothetical protein
MLTMAIEFIQATAMGPSIKTLLNILYIVGMALSMDLSDVLDLKNGVFWVVVDVFFGLVFLYM